MLKVHSPLSLSTSPSVRCWSGTDCLTVNRKAGRTPKQIPLSDEHLCPGHLARRRPRQLAAEKNPLEQRIPVRYRVRRRNILSEGAQRM